jgi:hypothetical protein
VFDEDGQVTDVVPEDDAFTHTLIEMFMVEANEALARTFADIDGAADPPRAPGAGHDRVHRPAPGGAHRRSPPCPRSRRATTCSALLDQTRGTPAERSDALRRCCAA